VILMASDIPCQTVPFPQVEGTSASQAMSTRAGFAAPVRDGEVTAHKITDRPGSRPIDRASEPAAEPSESDRLAKLEQRWLRVIRRIAYGGVVLLTLGASA
jgi:hypothetical protein